MKETVSGGREREEGRQREREHSMFIALHKVSPQSTKNAEDRKV